MSYCAECGAGVRETAKFCEGCGTPLGSGSGRTESSTIPLSETPTPRQPNRKVLSIAAIASAAVVGIALIALVATRGGHTANLRTASHNSLDAAPITTLPPTTVPATITPPVTAPPTTAAPTTTAPPPPTTALPTTTTLVRHTLKGDLFLVQDQIKTFTENGQVTKNNPVCSGIDGYADLKVGTSVTVRDQSGTIIATGAVDRAQWENLQTSHFDGTQGVPAVDIGGTHYDGSPGLPPSDDVYGSCRLFFTVNNVPDSPFYSIEVAHRGQTNHSRDELTAARWNVKLTLV